MFQQLLSWACRRPARPSLRRRPQRRAVLTLEALEDRTVPAITIRPSTLTAAAVAAKYSQAIMATGGTAPYHFTVDTGLPTGLLLSASGTLSGTPTAGGPFTFTVMVTDSAATPGTASKQYKLTVAAPTIVINPNGLTTATVGANYNQTLTGSGGTAQYKNFAFSGTLPGGLALSPTGVLSGKPTAAGKFTFTVTADDSSTGTGPYTGSRTYTLTVITFTLGPTTLATPQVASPYNQTLHASGGTAPYHYSVSSGSLPQGLTLNATTGRISGTPRAQGTFKFTIQATDSGTGAPLHAIQSYALTVRQGRPSQAAFAIALSGAAVNGPLAMFQVQVQDALHNPLPGVVVNLRLITLGAVGPAGFGAGSVVRAVTGANGIATFTGITITTRGVYEIEADAGTTSALSNVFEVGLNGRHSP